MMYTWGGLCDRLMVKWSNPHMDSHFSIVLENGGFDI